MRGAGGGIRTHNPLPGAVFETAAYSVPPRRLVPLRGHLQYSRRWMRSSRRGRTGIGMEQRRATFLRWRRCSMRGQHTSPLVVAVLVCALLALLLGVAIRG